MDRHVNDTPLPPSPADSEPPPSYDSLATTTQPRHSLLHSAAELPAADQPSLLSPAAIQPAEQEPQPVPMASESGTHREDGGEGADVPHAIDGPPPPPYSPGLRNFLGVISGRQQLEEGEAPPSYYSLFGQIQEARQQTSNNVSFLKKLCRILLGKIGCTVLLIVLMSVPLAVMVFGVVYVGKCPLQPFIPLFLVVGGLAALIKMVLLLTENIVKQKSSTLSSRVRHPKLIVRLWRVFNFLFNLFLMALGIAEGYWVFSTYREVITSEYVTCHPVLYKFAFSLVICSYVVILLTFSATFLIAGTSIRRRKMTSSLTRSARERSRRGNAESAEATSGEGTREEADGEVEDVMPAEYGFAVGGVADESVEMQEEEGEREGGGDGDDGGTSRMEEDPFPSAVGESLDMDIAASRVDMDQQAMSTGNLTNPTNRRSQPSELRLVAHNSDLQLPDMRQQSHRPRMAHSLLRFESSPYPNYPLRHASFGSNDSGLLPSQSPYATRFKPVTGGPLSFSQFLGSQTRPHSSFRSLCDMDPRRYSLRLSRNGSFRAREGTESNRSSLYNTVQSDGFSITAV